MSSSIRRNWWYTRPPRRRSCTWIVNIRIGGNRGTRTAKAVYLAVERDDGVARNRNRVRRLQCPQVGARYARGSRSGLRARRRGGICRARRLREDDLEAI